MERADAMLTLVENHGAVMQQEAITVVTGNRVRIRTGMKIDRNNGQARPPRPNPKSRCLAFA